MQNPGMKKAIKREKARGYSLSNLLWKQVKEKKEKGLTGKI